MNRIITTILKIFFKLLYHQFAWLYDGVATLVSLGRWNHWIMSALPYIQGDRVLEIGHGTGHLLVEMASRGLKPIGLDESRQMGYLSASRLEKIQSIPDLISGYAQNIPLKSRSINTVVVTFPTEYIFDSLALAEIKRVLMPDGILLVLPATIIDPIRLIDCPLHWLFRITRQAPDQLDRDYIDQVSTPFVRSGFLVDYRIMSVRHSQVLLLICSLSDDKALTKESPQSRQPQITR